MSNVYIEDFLYVIDTIKSIHPIGVLGLSKGFLSYVESLKIEIKDKNSLIRALSLTTAQLKDGHTNIEIPYKYDDLCLNIPCRWFNHSLYVIENYKDLQKGDVIEYITEPLPAKAGRFILLLKQPKVVQYQSYRTSLFLLNLDF